ncbi:RNA binding motif protein 12Bb [Myripristis murdjan]|uniref:RNA binding motif protein 12Bb n=1 Tax=Myripristis murdjan TaxID=586833 RepID=A0A668AQW5_9TELE|nr:RNA-binding protein 12B-like [Myripristis murdjan]
MAVVIRLQGLRITAGSEDIRNFFTGLKIPDGGVHIIGGEQEEAFIIFASDEDARRAMIRSGGCIKGSPVNLLLSSKSEMQSILEESTKNAELDQKRSLKENSRRFEMDGPGGSRRAGQPEAGRRSGSRSGHSPLRHRAAPSASSDDVYLLLKGMPFSVTEKEICHFFHGLLVDDIILMKNARGQNNGIGLVKFTAREDARDGLKRDREYIGSRFVEVYAATEQEWRNAGGTVAMGGNSNGKFGRGRSPVPAQRYPQHRMRSRSPVEQRSNSPSTEEFCVLVENLSYSVEKRHIKELFRHARLEDDQILYLHDSEGRRMRSVFVLFKSLRDYCAALTHNNEEFLSRAVHISPISREKMISILESRNMKDGAPGRSGRFQDRPGDSYDSEKLCLYVRNMPFDVRKVEIMDFFLGFNITEDKVILLRDHKGAGLGEALVVFRSAGEAVSAQALNGQRFLGSEVMLKCISRSQMQEFGVEPPAVQEPVLREERYSARNSDASYRPGDMEYQDLRIPPDGRMPMTNLQVHIHGGSSYDPFAAGPYTPQDGGNESVHGRFGAHAQNFDGPTCLKLVNLPLQIKIDEIYDFCYGYRVIPGSVSLQYDKNGTPKGSATVVFESRQEALTAVKELSGRPIGARKIQLVFV